MPLTENQALINLRVDPANFLARYALYIAGDLNNGIVNCAIMDMASPVMRPGSILRTKNMHATQTFMIGPVSVVGNVGPNFQAHWLKMSEWQTARDIYNIQVKTLDGTGPELLFTVMLSGCAIAIREDHHRNLHYVSRDTQDAIAAKKADIAISKYSDHNLPPAQSADAESVLAQLGPEVAAALRTLLATARAAA
jgi:hypothetical protein